MDIPSSPYNPHDRSEKPFEIEIADDIPNGYSSDVAVDSEDGGDVTNKVIHTANTPRKLKQTLEDIHEKQQERARRIYRPMSSSSPSRDHSNGYSRSLGLNKNSSPRASANTPRNKHEMETNRRSVQRDSNTMNSRSRLEDTRKYELFRREMEAESQELEVDVGVLIEEEIQTIHEQEQFEIEQYELEMMLNDMTISDI